LFRCDPDRRPEQELTAAHDKGGFGFGPLLASLAREVLAGVLPPGNASANRAGPIAPPKLGGDTLPVSNLGMHPVR
jgi:hypothetical protein